jgi:hypothetical protein
MKWSRFEQYLLLVGAIIVGMTVWYIVMSALNGRFLLLR